MYNINPQNIMNEKENFVVNGMYLMPEMLIIFQSELTNFM